MKANFLKFLACPICRKELRLRCFEKKMKEIKSGVLICSDCKLIYPIYDYMPRMFPYKLSEYSKFKEIWRNEIEKTKCSFPRGKPEKGEEFIQKSYSALWEDYQYGKALWGYNFDRLTKLIFKQLGYSRGDFKRKSVVDVGCGNGVITELISRFGAETIGLDINYSLVKAARHFIKNKKVHFVQGTLFHPPFKKGIFDVVYSTGVLHHTYNTKKAFFSIVDLCKSGGRTYIWLYGDYKGFAKLFNYFTNSIRYFVSRLPTNFQNVVLEITAIFYGFAHSKLRRYVLKSPIIKYNKNQLMHTVRDRFTPIYAHMHKSSEVVEWFSNAGFTNITLIEEQGLSIRGDNRL